MFSEEYGHIRSVRWGAVGDSGIPVRENVVQCIWYDQIFEDEGLCTDDGKSLKVLSAGWWNHNEGPDFKGAQIQFGNKLKTGDIEIHLTHSAWKQHGHHLDDRYNDVILHVVLDTEPPKTKAQTAKGHRIPNLLLGRFLDGDIRTIADNVTTDDYPYDVKKSHGHCAALANRYGNSNATRLLNLAGEWRMLNKARNFRERMDRVGAEQALYESLMSACGYSRFKHHFHLVAKHLPYERVRQLVHKDPMLAEAALLTISGLLPDELPDNAGNVPHFKRLLSLRQDKLSGLRKLPLEWKRIAVRPTNNPERRMSGMARILSRTASSGLLETFEDIWRHDWLPLKRRIAFEKLFPRPVGFWATHCTWTGKKMTRPIAPIGAGRIRSIIGNIIVPCALALSRKHKDRSREEAILDFYCALPKENENNVLKIMLPRIFGDKKTRLAFRTQQGLIQIYQDWCEANPSCRKCSLADCLDVELSAQTPVSYATT